VDWRDDLETVLCDVKRMLPVLEYRRIAERTFELRCHGAWHRLTAPEGTDSELLLQSINRALSPEYEMRIFTPTMGDAYSLLVRPTKWWNEFSAEHGACAQKLFVTTEERAALTRPDNQGGRSFPRD
jgi:hypothetical protein